jgi:transposase-like protein
MERIPASERAREKLKAVMEGRGEVEDGRSELVRLAARLIIEEALEGEARDALGRDYYAPRSKARRRLSQRSRLVRNARDRWFADSPLEGAGFEPSVPLGGRTRI